MVQWKKLLNLGQQHHRHLRDEMRSRKLKIPFQTLLEILAFH